jgi:hypothetical protein
MDNLTRAFYELMFENSFMKKKADEFQDFFASIMEKRYPGDFIRIRPWGQAGDHKNDGYLRSRRILFQSYAPDKMQVRRCIAKIAKDFDGALLYWKDYFDTWIFVHNAPKGLGPQVKRTLLDLGVRHAPLQVGWWGFEELRQEAMELTEHHLASLLGWPPSRKGFLDLDLDDLAPILDHIALLQASPDPDLRPVPADKLQLNLLSNNVQILLKAGMSKSALVREYFRLTPNKLDEIRESFRRRYQSLRDSGQAPDEIFASLQQYAGGPVVPVPSPARQCAVLAVVAFFFEECDIFERPEA